MQEGHCKTREEANTFFFFFFFLLELGCLPTATRNSARIDGDLGGCFLQVTVAGAHKQGSPPAGGGRWAAPQTRRVSQPTAYVHHEAVSFPQQ